MPAELLQLASQEMSSTVPEALQQLQQYSKDPLEQQQLRNKDAYMAWQPCNQECKV